MDASFFPALKQFDIELKDDLISEDQLLAILSERVAYLLEHKTEQLMSILYRMDVDESKVQEALLAAQETPPHLAIAKLILQRQKDRLSTKYSYKQPPIPDWEDF